MSEVCKVLYNARYGGFGISKKTREIYNKRSPGKELPKYDWDIDREDPILISIVEEIGAEEASNRHALLKIMEIPIEYKDCYKISEYDGFEGVVCDPDKLAAHLLKNADIAGMNDEEAKKFLSKLKKIVMEDKE